MGGLTTYAWKPRTNIQVDAQVAGERLEDIRVRNNGHLTARAVVEDAREAESPLHPAFEWKDRKAAANWREYQAQHLIRSIVVVGAEETQQARRPVRAFVNVTVDESSHYTSIAHAMSSEELRQQVLRRALRELEEWRERYRDLEEFAALFEVVDAEVEKHAA